MDKSLKTLTIILISVASLTAGVVHAQAEKIRLTLSEAIQRALMHNAEIKMKGQNVKFAQSRLEEVQAHMLPTISSLTGVAPIFKETGNALITTEDTGKWGPLFKHISYVVQPIYGFGKFEEYTKAAKGGITAEREQKKMAEAEVIFDIKKYYYTAQMASQMNDRLAESEEKLVGVIKRIDQLLKMESGEIKQEDALKLKVLLHELRQKRELAGKGAKLTVAAIGYKSGIAPGHDVRLKSNVLKREKFSLRSLSHYQKMALDKRPEMSALNAGLTARKALVAAEKTNRLPLFFLGGFLEVNDTPNSIRNRQSSAYAYDPFNSIQGIVGLGFKWNLDIWKVNAKISGLNAEYLKLVHQKEMAETGIPVQVKKAYLEYKEAQNNIKHSTEQRRLAKKWFLQAAFAWGFGIGDSREVLESVIFKGFSDKNYYDAILNHNVAIGALSHSTGTELLESLKY